MVIFRDITLQKRNIAYAAGQFRADSNYLIFNNNNQPARSCDTPLKLHAGTIGLGKICSMPSAWHLRGISIAPWYWLADFTELAKQGCTIVV